MHVIHGTWIPQDTNEFAQRGTFWLWVETDAPVKLRKRVGDWNLHPRHLAHEALETFLAEKVKLPLPWGADINRVELARSISLPTAGGAPLPSYEIAPYMEEEVPDQWELSPWQVYAFPLRAVISQLNDIHFMALHSADDFQLGADLLFWWQYGQELKRLIVTDQYIPSLRYRALDGSKKGQLYEIHAGWEFCTPAYDALVARYAACMPLSCVTGSEVREAQVLYSPESLLRHFSENRLEDAVISAGSSALERQIADSLLDYSFHPLPPIPASDRVLRMYEQWQDWRARLTAGHRDAGFTLGFRLEESMTGDQDDWYLRFVVVSRRDPSLRIPLSDYWTLDSPGRAALQSHMGEDFERHLLLALGYAARIYPDIWNGLETDQPTGLQLSLQGAYAFLKEHAWVLEDAGFTVIVPGWWTRQGKRRAKVRLTTATESASMAVRSHFSLDTVINFDYQLSIDGRPVSPDEWQQLVEAKTSLIQFRGEWMEVDHDQIQRMLAVWGDRKEDHPELTLLDLMKLAADHEEDVEWEHDDGVQQVLEALQDKRVPEIGDDLPNFHGTLREYQKVGTGWLRYLESMDLSPLLADDMGLGKTVQVIAQLVAERNECPDVPPTLLIAPTSVLGNWRKEIERFAPHLRVLVHHGPERSRDARAFSAACAENDVVVTSFALARLDATLLRTFAWHRVVVDEAQNIKNPDSAQTRAITKLDAPHRLALTGTPVENRLRDLWSIFNFLNPGYLGKESQFRKAFEIPIEKHNDPARSAALRRLVEPFILRRLKTDRQIIQDLPDKIEQKVYCNLTPEQASLYEAVVRDVEEQLKSAEGMQRRGLILSTLLKLKQICNHPAQFLHDGSAFTGERSHKLHRLTEMLDEVLANGESALVFTQFTEAGEALERHIKHSLHCTTYYLHGGTSMKKREQMVAAFQTADAESAVFILSVRAGGTGLTLTKANNVFHFDRWWNPAVEDQATDRAFRIGQSKNVFAHKFVALGTVEERIDAMIEDKKGLAATIVGSDEGWITEMDNAAFSDLIALRKDAVLG